MLVQALNGKTTGFCLNDNHPVTTMFYSLSKEVFIFKSGISGLVWIGLRGQPASASKIGH